MKNTCYNKKNSLIYSDPYMFHYEGCFQKNKIDIKEFLTEICVVKGMLSEISSIILFDRRLRLI